MNPNNLSSIRPQERGGCRAYLVDGPIIEHEPDRFMKRLHLADNKFLEALGLDGGKAANESVMAGHAVWPMQDGLDLPIL